jgi:hypothetical protein
MVRIGLITYLMLATTAGPWVCCCTAGQVTNALASTLPGQGDVPSNPICHSSTCCHRNGTPATQQEPKKSDSERPQREGPSCPCQDYKPVLASLVSPDQSNGNQVPRQLSQQAVELVPAFLSVLGLFSISNPEAIGGVPILPFLTAQDLLHTHHVLRC